MLHGRRWPGTRTETTKRPGAASLVNADLMLFFGKNDFWYNGNSTVSMQHRAVDPRYSSYYYSHGYPGFVLVQVGAASGASDSETTPEADAAAEAATGCPEGAGPKSPGKCTAPCPVAPAAGGYTKYAHTCVNDASTCPPKQAVCGCTRSQLGHGKCTSRADCLAEAAAACEANKRCFSFAIACSCNVTSPQPPADMMWETYPLGSASVVRNPTWTSYTRVAPPAPPPPPPPPPPELRPFAVCMGTTHCVGRAAAAGNATAIVLRSFMGLSGKDPDTNQPTVGTMGTPAEYLWLLVDGQLQSTCTQPVCLAMQCLGSSVYVGDYSMVDCASAKALNISFPSLQMRQTHANGTLVGCISGDRCQQSISTKLKLTPGCNDPAFFEACGHNSVVLRMSRYFANSLAKRTMQRFSASHELTNARLNVSSGVTVNGDSANLVSSTFVAKSRNLAITKLHLEATQMAPTVITVGTSN